MSEFELEQLGRHLTTLHVQGRTLVGVDTDPLISIHVRTREYFWLPDIALVALPTATIDGDLVTRDASAAEFYAQDGGGSGWHWRVAPEYAVREKGLHVLSGAVRIWFVERLSDARVYTSDLSARSPREGQRVFGECLIRIPSFHYTVADSVPDPVVEVTDADLATATIKRMQFGNLRWIPLGSANHNGTSTPYWKVDANFDEQFSFLAFELELRDADNRLLGRSDVLVSPLGKVINFVAYDGIVSPVLQWGEMYGLHINPSHDLEFDDAGEPIFTNPVTAEVRSSQRVARNDSRVRAMLKFSLSKAIADKLR